MNRNNGYHASDNLKKGTHKSVCGLKHHNDMLNSVNDLLGAS